MATLATNQLQIVNLDLANNTVFFTYVGSDNITYSLSVTDADVSSLTALNAQMATVIAGVEDAITAGSSVDSTVTSAVGVAQDYDPDTGDIS